MVFIAMKAFIKSQYLMNFRHYLSISSLVISNNASDISLESVATKAFTVSSIMTDFDRLVR